MTTKLVLVQGRYFNSWEATGLGMIASYVRAHAPDTVLSFHHGAMDKDEDIIRDCADADIVAFSCTSPTFAFAQRIAARVKAINPNVWVVAGGYHPSVLTGDCIGAGIDQVVTGEGEEAMLDIVRGNRERVVQGRPMEFKELPWPDRHLIRNERHIEVARRDTGKRITSFQSHRGCPFACRFCADGKRKALSIGRLPVVRFRDVADLVNEIESVTNEYKLDLIKFCDPTWNTHPLWVTRFCFEKIRRNLAVPFFANIHARTCSERMFAMMKLAGCSDIGLGVESGSEKVLAGMGKAVTKDHIRSAVKWAKAARIKVRGYFILGMPNETNEDLEQTEQFAEELALDEYGFTILCPYPGTDFYEPELMGGVDWSGTDEYSNDFWRTETLTNAELKAWQARLVAKFGKKLTWHQGQKK